MPIGRSLWIQGSEFEDLDEIIARHVTPMAGLARDLISFKYYKPLCGIRDKAEEILKEEKSKNSNKIHYVISAAKSYPGRFLLSYLPRAKCRHEYVSVSPDGYKFRQRMFDSLPALLKWFKEHFSEPPPVAAPPTRTPALRTPHGLASTLYHTPAAHTPGPAYINTPYTPSAQTPYMTPFAATPRQPDFLTPAAPRHKPVVQMPVYTEPSDWQKAAEDWVRHRNTARDTPSTPRTSEGMSTPRTMSARSTPRMDTRSTPRMDARSTPRMDVRSTPRMDVRSTPSGRSSRATSVRSTPHTNTSPRSMSLGDATPLYDEN